MRFSFITEQDLPFPLETVFAFFADPANLPRLMPAWQDARIETADYVAPPAPFAAFAGSESILAGSGTQMTLSLKPLPFAPFRLPWVALIEDFRWLEGFCDVQLRGPFHYWRHCHTVQATRVGTHLTDAVEYEPPLGLLGGIANSLLLRRQLAATFRYRQKRTLELLSAQASSQKK